MSTETTNKKIKIDNGTTFGRTYTDKAVDELLKGVGSGGGTSVIELTDKNGTIASAQLGEINANPQNFSFKYNGKILSFTSADSTTYQYCNNTTSSSENNVMTTSTIIIITSSTGAYTIAENVHNVVANSIHPANGGDLTNIQVGSKVYSIPSGGGNYKQLYVHRVRATDFYDYINIIITLDSAELIDTKQKLRKALASYLIDIFSRYPAIGKKSDNVPITGLAYKLNSVLYVFPKYDTTINKIVENSLEIGDDWYITDEIVAPEQE